MSIDMDQLDAMGESFAQLATNAPQQVKDRIAKYRYYCGLQHNSFFSFSNVIIEDLSNGCERFPVRVINDMDKTHLSAFKYANRVIDEHGLLNLPEDELAKCSCSSNISCIETDSCDCCASGNRYNSKGYLIADPQNEFSSIMECTKLCGCSMLCGNRVAQKGATFPIEIFRTTAKGWGVRSRAGIPLGAFIGEYTGLVLPESLANGDRDDSYVFETKWLDDQPICIDGKPAGNFTRFINHSCNPNAKVFNVNWDHKKSQLYHVCIYADRFIVKGEEITINYGSLWWKSKNEVICKCDYENCLYREVRTEQTGQSQERAEAQTDLTEQSQ
ncbi:hypothetical protein WR25_16698 [Diploscapter pachys]|uniref:SET domain-containing protein n=1 Tax=Diploscapter pachys TaxID=2018661 RepID=A0A2A2LTV6_9BILA|nr:hypothetical protein WR25_16698 [Diploscapter pachys]